MADDLFLRPHLDTTTSTPSPPPEEERAGERSEKISGGCFKMRIVPKPAKIYSCQPRCRAIVFTADDTIHSQHMNTMHEVDYKIYVDDMQYVEVELDPMEAAVAEAGGMMYMDDGIEMETIFGDGSQQNNGFLGALVSAGKRLLTGESLFMTVFQNRGLGKKRVAFGAPYPGKIIPVHLAEIGGEGLFFATLRGPGRIWLQSLPLSRLADRIIAAAPKAGGKGREEGSVLGGLGRLIDGDNP